MTPSDAMASVKVYFNQFIFSLVLLMAAVALYHCLTRFLRRRLGRPCELLLVLVVCMDLFREPEASSPTPRLTGFEDPTKIRALLNSSGIPLEECWYWEERSWSFWPIEKDAVMRVSASCISSYNQLSAIPVESSGCLFWTVLFVLLFALDALSGIHFTWTDPLDPKPPAQEALALQPEQPPVLEALALQPGQPPGQELLAPIEDLTKEVRRAREEVAKCNKGRVAPRQQAQGPVLVEAAPQHNLGSSARPMQPSHLGLLQDTNDGPKRDREEIAKEPNERKRVREEVAECNKPPSSSEKDTNDGPKRAREEVAKEPNKRKRVREEVAFEAEWQKKKAL